MQIQLWLIVQQKYVFQYLLNSQNLTIKLITFCLKNKSPHCYFFLFIPTNFRLWNTSTLNILVPSYLETRPQTTSHNLYLFLLSLLCRFFFDFRCLRSLLGSSPWLRVLQLLVFSVVASHTSRISYKTWVKPHSSVYLP